MTRAPCAAEEPDPVLEDALRRRLSTVADAGPTSDPDAALALARARRHNGLRRWGVPLAAVASIAAIVATLASGWNTISRDSPRPAAPALASTSSSDVTSQVPPGWRLEVYRDVSLAVPGDWGWGLSGSCGGGQTAESARVGRPGPVPAIGCPRSDNVVAESGSFVAFYVRSGGPNSEQPGPKSGDLEVRVIKDTAIAVQALTPVRERILASIRELPPTGVYGCPSNHPIVSNPAWRPPASGPIPAAAERISLCSYTLDQDQQPGGLLAVTALDPPAGRALLSALRDAAEGAGPNRPGDCADMSYGHQVTLVRIDPGPNGQDVVVRYDGCDHHGIDDGSRMRRLTKPVLESVLPGPHRPSRWSTAVAGLIPEPLSPTGRS